MKGTSYLIMNSLSLPLPLPLSLSQKKKKKKKVDRNKWKPKVNDS